MSTGWTFPTYACTVCGAEANHRVIGHPTIRGEVCQKHLPNVDDPGDVFALND